MSYVGRKGARAALIHADIPSNLNLLGSHVKIPTVTTANLPGAGDNASITPVDGMLVYNSTLGMLQQRAGGIWSGITTAPTIESFVYSDGASATAEKTVVGLVSVSCTTQTSTTVLVPGASLGIQVGMVVAGTGIPVGATVVSVIEDTSFVISAAATASATVTLTFGGAVTITGTNFDSILGGSSANIAVTFDGTTATSISVNTAKTIITCTPPAHAAGTITLLVTNASGLTASTNFVYDIEPVFTTAAGSLGGFLEGTTFTANASAPIIAGTENSVALTSGFARVTSATDDTVITTAINGLTLQGTGHLTGTLTAAANATTFPFYAVATDDEGQKTAPRLFNIISYDYAASGGNTVNTDDWISNYRIHVFTDDGSLVVIGSMNVDILIVAGGGSGGKGYAGGGGAGGLLYKTSHALTANTYDVVIGDGGATAGSASGTAFGNVGENTTWTINGGATIFTAYGGGKGGAEGKTPGGDGGSGGGNGYYTGASSATQNDQNGATGYGWAGGEGIGASNYNPGGGGGAGGVGDNGDASASGDGGPGVNYGAIFSTNVGHGGWFASGGGGGWTSQGGSSAGSASSGGGTAGGSGSGGASSAAVANSGGGSGGGASESATSGAGGSGIVVVRYAV